MSSASSVAVQKCAKYSLNYSIPCRIVISALTALPPQAFTRQKQLSLRIRAGVLKPTRISKMKKKHIVLPPLVRAGGRRAFVAVGKKTVLR